jgi:hypothetical protein
MTDPKTDEMCKKVATLLMHMVDPRDVYLMFPDEEAQMRFWNRFKELYPDIAESYARN